jgi:cytoskeletal protein CcmA (bactofilin family)
MFGKKDKAGKHVWNAFFSSSVEIEGSLRFTGLLNIDGNLTGAIVAHGMLVTGVNATINGDMFVENLILSGTVHGNIYVTGEVHLNNTAKVVGNINYSSLSIVPGAVHEGNSHLFTPEERDELLSRIQDEIGHPSAQSDFAGGRGAAKEKLPAPSNSQPGGDEEPEVPPLAVKSAS